VTTDTIQAKERSDRAWARVSAWERAWPWALWCWGTWAVGWWERNGQWRGRIGRSRGEELAGFGDLDGAKAGGEGRRDCEAAGAVGGEGDGRATVHAAHLAARVATAGRHARRPERAPTEGSADNVEQVAEALARRKQQARFQLLPRDVRAATGLGHAVRSLDLDLALGRCRRRTAHENRPDAQGLKAPDLVRRRLRAAQRRQGDGHEKRTTTQVHRTLGCGEDSEDPCVGFPGTEE